MRPRGRRGRFPGRDGRLPAAALAALSALAWSLAAPDAAAAQARTDEVLRELSRGRAVEIRLGDEKVRGELLAVSADSLWLLPTEGEPRALVLADLPEVAVRRHGLDGRKGLLWSVLGGTITGAALTAACSSVDGNDCSGVFPVTLGAWLFVGGLASLALERSSEAELPPSREALRPYARFPQGMPTGYPRDGGG